jgi:hypothetical protein
MFNIDLDCFAGERVPLIGSCASAYKCGYTSLYFLVQ